MKRALSLPAPNTTFVHDTQLPKRRKLEEHSRESRTSYALYNRAGSRTPPHAKIHVDTAEGRRKNSVEQWIKQCASGDELEMPPTPSVTTSRGSRRRNVKQLRRQRSQSPAKNVGSAQYRAMNMADASVFVDHFPEPPAEVEARLGHVFGEPSWSEDRQHLLKELAKQYCEECRVLAKKCAGENEWRSNLFLSLQQLSRLDTEVLMLSASEKPWSSTLKPTAPSSYELIASDTTQMEPVSQQTRPITSIFPNTPTFSATSTAASDVSSDNPNSLLTSKPDITLGMSHTSFTPLQKRVLRLLQDDDHVVSEPHQAQIGLRFPFLVVETKGGAAGGNMIGAHNQAAVDGACVMNILGDLQNVVARIMHHPDAGDGEESGPPAIAFSVATEGPLHEIWVHYRVESEYHMTCHRAWRMTHRKDADEFVQCLAEIIEWGRTDFRESILGLLGRIERPVLAGFLSSYDEEYS